MKFFPDDFSKIKGLEEIVDDSTTEITIKTPEGWKCERCSADYSHSHGVYNSLL